VAYLAYSTQENVRGHNNEENHRVDVSVLQRLLHEAFEQVRCVLRVLQVRKRHSQLATYGTSFGATSPTVALGYHEVNVMESDRTLW
jgi:hypothetical protein